MLDDTHTGRDAIGAPSRRLAHGFSVLVAVTVSLIVLGALVRAHEAGLACPDWPLCFGEFVPRMDLRVAFEWSHRVAAGSVSLLFAGLAVLTLRLDDRPRGVGALLVVAAILLLVQIVLGALTVWLKLASWTVTAHLVTGNSFAATLLLVAHSLFEHGRPPARRPVSASARGWVALASALLVLQMVLGGLVSSQYAGLACPEWPACNGGVWFPSWRGSVGLHLLHRLNGYALLAALGAAALAARAHLGLGGVTALALALGVAQVFAGIANVMLGIPVEVTGLHSALATALVLTLTLAMRETLRTPSPAV